MSSVNDPAADTSDAMLDALAGRLGKALLARELKLATAESCTGGWIAKCLTDIAGSSDWFERGYVTYSNGAKTAMLGVSAETLASHGAVSEQTVREMAAGAVRQSPAQMAVAVSGIAGPSGGGPGKPVGSVWIAWAWPDRSVSARQFRFSGDRENVRRSTVAEALRGLLDGIER
ncbi:MAG: nicotinamide-nucleotide amidase [Gammaproteobacteria bacterium]|nr:nicotinamide-nucleotide amidase [Gammaproteobacteria bacterium]